MKPDEMLGHVPGYDKKADPLDNIARGLFAIAHRLGDISYDIECLGNKDAFTEMGAIEALGVVMRDGLRDLAEAISTLQN